MTILKARLRGLALCLCAAVAGAASAAPLRSALTLEDRQRQRPVPVELYFPAQAATCSVAAPCPVALLGAGYGISHLDYSFIATALNRIGYLVVSVQHQLPGDAPFDNKGDLDAQRKVMWRRGALNLRFVQGALRTAYPGYQWSHPVLIGHSNGGDIAAWLASTAPDFASAVITLDSRRAALPRGTTPRVLSIRASDFAADPGVLPTGAEQRRDGSCVVKIAGAHHNDMEDHGSAALKRAIDNAIVAFLAEPGANGSRARCDQSLLRD